MRKQLIESIKTGEVPDDEIFIAIFEIPDELERQRFIEELRIRARDQKVLTTFNSMLKQWTARKAQEEKQLGGNRTRFTDAPLVLNCGRWEATDAGVTKYEPSRKAIACTHPILPVERLVNIDTNTEKLKLAFFKDERWQYVTVDCTTVYNKQNITALGDRGVMVTSETARDLVKYLSEVVSLNMTSTSESKAIPLYRSIARLGWIGNEFAPYVDGIKYDGDLDFESIYNQVCSMGSRDAWFVMAKDIRKDIVVRLLIATSLASSLIERVGALPFVFHLWGTTSFGKTVSLMVAMSVWGNPESGCLTRSMNMTQNAMARTASFLYNLPFGADELQQIRNRWDNFDNLIMYLTEGIDKGRAKSRGGIEELKTWRNCFIFTGEEPITKENSGGGVKNRVIEVEVTKPIYESGYMVANTVRENYGWAGREFIEYVKQIPIEELRTRYKAIFDEIMQTCDTTDKQAYSMALILLADELSCQCIFPEDTPIQIKKVTKYLHSSRTVDVSERAHDVTLSVISQNYDRFFFTCNRERWGKTDTNSMSDETVSVIWVDKKILEKILKENGFDYNAVIGKWDEKGYVQRNPKDNGWAKQMRITGPKVYCIGLNVGENFGVEVDEPLPDKFVQQNVNLF